MASVLSNESSLPGKGRDYILIGHMFTICTCVVYIMMVLQWRLEKK